MANSNYQIFVTAKVLKGDVQKQLDEIANGLKSKLKVDLQGTDKAASGLKDVSDSANKANDSVNDLNLTFNVANEIFNKSIDTIKSFVEQVYTLNDAMTEFKKVSDLRGSELDDYVDKLAESGRIVARTGKPNRSEPGCWDSKPAA